MKRPAILIGAALVAVLVLGLVAILIGSRPARRDATGPRDGVRNAAFDLLDGATSVRVRAASIGDDLYQISVPSDAGIQPRVDRDGGDVRLRLEPTGDGGGSGVVDILLNSSVTWSLRMTGGAREMHIDMSGAAVDQIALAGGASLIDVALARPSRVVAVAMTGGVDQFRVRLPSSTPVRVTASSGAGTVTVFGQTHQGVAGGQSFTANGWSDGAPGVDVQARAGAGVVIVDA
ncbi:hypothetical protein ACQPZX_08860 [Actinoplanes sp. CA-142083]|uniref:hypothetical protein n=1 Tax=Actinoplanes sp. CA-142083 TaxID=3239903 RepID=UPI003D8B3D55